MTSLIIINLFFGCSTLDSKTEKNNAESAVQAVSIPQTKGIQATKDANFEKTKAQNIQHKKQLYDQAPASAQKLLPFLSAHHANDLPDKNVLNKHEKAEEGLLWIAQSGQNIGVRSRSLHLLRFYDSAETTTLLLSIAKDESENYLLRSAALSSIGSWSLEKRTAQVDVLSQALDAKNPVIVVNAITASQSIAALAQKIETLQKTHPSSLVRDTIKK